MLFAFHEQAFNGVHIVLDLCRNCFGVKLGQGDISIGYSFPGLIKSFKKSYDIRQTVLIVKHLCGVPFGGMRPIHVHIKVGGCGHNTSF